MDDAAAEAFSAWPERIFLGGTNGRIRYRGEPGPWGFDPEEARRHLLELLLTPGNERPVS